MKKFTPPPPRIEKNKIIAPFAILICTVLMSLTCYNNPFAIGNCAGDSATYTYMARLLLNGGMIYRDASDNKGPVMYFIDALGLYLNKDIGIWIMEFAFIFVALLFAYKIARLIGCGKVKSIVVVAISTLAFEYYFEGGNMIEEYACTFIMISLYIFLKFFKNDTVSFFELLACGFTFGAVALIRINMVALWTAMFIAIFIYCVQKHEITKFVKYVLAAFLGAAIIIVPIMVWLVKNEAFTRFIEDYFLFSLALTSSLASLYTVIRAIYKFIIGGLVVFSFPIITYFCLKENKAMDWSCGLAVIISILMMNVNGTLSMHYGMVLVPFVAYAASRLLNKIPNTSFSVPNVLGGACLIFLLFARSFLYLSAGVIINYHTGVYAASLECKEIAEIIKANTNENDKISVCSLHPLIYILSDRMSASVYFGQAPENIQPGITTNYLNDIKSLKAKIIVIDKNSDWHKHLDEIISSHYFLLEQVGRAEIYKLKEQAS